MKVRTLVLFAIGVVLLCSSHARSYRGVYCTTYDGEELPLVVEGKKYTVFYFFAGWSIKVMGSADSVDFAFKKFSDEVGFRGLSYDDSYGSVARFLRKRRYLVVFPFAVNPQISRLEEEYEAVYPCAAICDSRGRVVVRFVYLDALPFLLRDLLSGVLTVEEIEELAERRYERQVKSAEGGKKEDIEKALDWEYEKVGELRKKHPDSLYLRLLWGVKNLYRNNRKMKYAEEFAPVFRFFPSNSLVKTLFLRAVENESAYELGYETVRAVEREISGEDRAEYYHLAGWMAFLAGHFSEAHEYYRKSREIADEAVRRMLDYDEALLLAAEGRKNESYELYKKALSKETGGASLQLRYAVDDAKKAYERFKSPFLLFVRGLLLERVDPREAVRAYQKFLESGGEKKWKEEAKNRLEKLSSSRRIRER